MTGSVVWQRLDLPAVARESVWMGHRRSPPGPARLAAGPAGTPLTSCGWRWAQHSVPSPHDESMAVRRLLSLARPAQVHSCSPFRSQPGLRALEETLPSVLPHQDGDQGLQFGTHGLGREALMRVVLPPRSRKHSVLVPSLWVRKRRHSDLPGQRHRAGR